jgi:hypothetical protein
MQWRTSLRAHWRALLAADFFTTEVWTVRGLVTYYTVFVIKLHTRQRPELRDRHQSRQVRGGCPR